MADIYALVANDAIARAATARDVFEVTCNCGGSAPLIDDQEIRCPRCLRSIAVIVIEGDPGYVVGATPSGEPTLLPVQGSTAPSLASMTPEERREVLSKLGAASGVRFLDKAGK